MHSADGCLHDIKWPVRYYRAGRAPQRNRSSPPARVAAPGRRETIVRHRVCPSVCDFCRRACALSQPDLTQWRAQSRFKSRSGTLAGPRRSCANISSSCEAMRETLSFKVAPGTSKRTRDESPRARHPPVMRVSASLERSISLETGVGGGPKVVRGRACWRRRKEANLAARRTSLIEFSRRVDTAPCASYTPWPPWGSFSACVCVCLWACSPWRPPEGKNLRCGSIWLNLQLDSIAVAAACAFLQLGLLLIAPACMELVTSAQMHTHTAAGQSINLNQVPSEGPARGGRLHARKGAGQRPGAQQRVISCE